MRHAFVLHARLHAANLLHLLGREGCRVAVRVDELHEGLAELWVTADGAGSGERLELPGFGPTLVVGAVGVQRSHDGTLLAFGAQVGVHFEGAFGANRGLDGLLEQGEGAVHDARSLFLRGVLVDPFERFVYEHNIRVGPEAVLGPAQATHADDGDASE